jgi:hypothetical protein
MRGRRRRGVDVLLDHLQYSRSRAWVSIWCAATTPASRLVVSSTLYKASIL